MKKKSRVSIVVRLGDDYKRRVCVCVGFFCQIRYDGLLRFHRIVIYFDIDTRISVRNVIKLIWHYLLLCSECVCVCAEWCALFCVSFVLFSNFTRFFASSLSPSRCRRRRCCLQCALLYRFFVDCLMKRKNPYVIQYACCRRFIKIRKLYREIFSIRRIMNIDHHRIAQQCRIDQWLRRKKNMWKLSWNMPRFFSISTIFFSRWVPEQCHPISLLSFLLFIIIIAFCVRSTNHWHCIEWQ